MTDTIKVTIKLRWSSIHIRTLVIWVVLECLQHIHVQLYISIDKLAGSIDRKYNFMYVSWNE